MSDINCGLYIEANVELADKLQDLVLSILNTSAGDSVKEKALDILQEAFPKPAPNSINNCYFTTEQKKEEPADTELDEDFDEEEHY